MRLDDACPQMNIEKWNRIETLLDRYDIRPIVGVIPDNKDLSINFDYDDLFWDKVQRWKMKGWTIAQHGYQHKLEQKNCNNSLFRVVETETEFVGKDKTTQKDMIRAGYNIMKVHGCEPTCFFAPSHTFDVNTVLAIQELNLPIEFISDGYDLMPYKKHGMVFIPAMFDSPHILTGVQTFISHPNNLTDSAYAQFESFFMKYHDFFVEPLSLLSNMKIKNSQGVLGKILEETIYYIRKVRLT
jgi:hypothetical protein